MANNLSSFSLWALILSSMFLEPILTLSNPKNIRTQRHHRDGATTVSSETTNTLLENDPCLIQYCMKGRECVVQQGTPKCVCAKSCPEHIKPVCGSDGTIYNNHCEMHIKACREEKRITHMPGTFCIRLPIKPNHPAGLQTSNNTALKTISWLQQTTVKPVQQSTTTAIPQDKSTPAAALTPMSQDHEQDTPTTESVFSNALPSDTETIDDSENEIKDDHPYGKNDCAMQEYEVMKDNLLLYNHARLMSQDNQSRDYLLSIMFSHYDRNNNGQLETNELNEVATEEHMDSITSLTSGCSLSTMIKYDDTDHDEKLSINEFYVAFSKLYSVSVVSLDKALEINHLSARVGDNVEIKCDVTGSPVPPIVWSRNGLNLATLGEEDIRVFSDGSLYLTHIQLQHAGNYTCHAQRNKDVVQTHVLTVYTVPEVHVTPRIQSKRPGEDATMLCHVAGEPFPKVEWLKNDEPLKSDNSRKYQVIGNGTSLKIKDIDFADTGAYMCQATNIGGLTRDISSLVVEEQPTPSSPNEERRFFALHDWGISIYEPSTCKLYHKIHSTDVIPGTQENVCGDRGTKCDWGRAINVANRYVYASQPKRDRVLIISKVQMVVVDVVPTDKYPVELYYVPHLDQVWVLNWRSLNNTGIKTIQVIRDAGQKRKHHTVHPEPIDGQFDLVTGLFIPSPFQELSHYSFKYGYVTHTNQRGLYKLDLVNLRYTRSVDLTPYNCVPIQVQFSALYGMVFMECIEPITNRPTGQLILDYLTDTVIGTNPLLSGIPYISPDSRKLVTFDKTQNGATLIVQQINANGLEFLFDVKTTLNISDLTYYPSQSTHSYDLYASGQNKEDILYVNLSTGKVEVITGVGKATLPEFSKWNKPNRPIRASGLFGQYMVTSASEALFVINGRSRTVNCEIGGVFHPSQIVWTTIKLH